LTTSLFIRSFSFVLFRPTPMPLRPVQQRSLGSIESDPRFVRAANALMHETKNLINSTLFAVRVFWFGLRADGSLKPKETPKPKTSEKAQERANKKAAEKEEKSKEAHDILLWAAEANARIKAWNQQNWDDYAEAHAKACPGGMGPPLKPLPDSKTLDLFLPELLEPPEADGSPCKAKRAKRDQILNMAVLGILIHDRPDAKGRVLYDALPGVAASETLQRVAKGFKTHQKAMRAWRKSDKKAGRPQPPGFMEKRERATMFFPSGSSFHFEKGLRGEKGNLRFGGMKVKKTGLLRTVFADYEQTDSLTPEDLKAFTDYDLQGKWDAIKQKNCTPDGARLAEIRLVPQKGGLSVKVEFVMNWDKPFKAGSFGERIYQTLNRIDPEMDPAKCNTEIIKLLFAMKAADLPVMAGADPGVNNLISVATTEGSEAIVISAAALERRVAWHDRRIEKQKTDLTTPRLRELQEKRTRGQEAERSRREAQAQIAAEKAKAEKDAKKAEKALSKKRAAKAKKDATRDEKAQQNELVAALMMAPLVAAAKAAALASPVSDDTLAQFGLDCAIEGDLGFPSETIGAEPERSSVEADGFEGLDAATRAETLAEMAEEEEALAADPTHALTPAEFTELKKGLSKIYKDPCLIAMHAKRAAAINDFLHKASKGLIQQLSARGVELLVLGHNSSWKNDANMNTAQNRRLYSVAHRAFYDMLAYKGLEASILVVEVEESYTSKVSFVMNEKMRKHYAEKTPEEKAADKIVREAKKEAAKNSLMQSIQKSVAQQEKEAEAAANNAARRSPASAVSSFLASTEGDCPPAQKASGELADAELASWVAMGVRKGHWFTSPDAKGHARVVHADVNGAFNILRKACPAFQFHDGLSLGFKIWWLNPKTGLSQRQLRREDGLRGPRDEWLDD